MRKLLLLSIVIALCACQGQESNSAFGTVEREVVLVTAAADGLITEVTVKKGEQVAAGQLLVQQETTEQRLLLAQVQAELAAAQAKLELMQLGSRTEQREQAKANLARAEAKLVDARLTQQRQAELLAQQLNSQAAVQQADAALAVAVAEQRAAQPFFSQWLGQPVLRYVELFLDPFGAHVLKRHHGRGHRAGRHRVDADVRRELVRQRLGETDDAGLGRAVGRKARAAQQAQVGRDVDDGTAPLGHHARQHRAAHQEHGVQVDRHHAAPVGVHRLDPPDLARQKLEGILDSDKEGRVGLYEPAEHVLSEHADQVGNWYARALRQRHHQVVGRRQVGRRHQGPALAQCLFSTGRLYLAAKVMAQRPPAG